MDEKKNKVIERIPRSQSKEIRILIYNDENVNDENIVRVALGDWAIDAVLRHYDKEEIIHDSMISSIKGISEIVDFTSTVNWYSGYFSGNGNNPNPNKEKEIRIIVYNDGESNKAVFGESETNYLLEIIDYSNEEVICDKTVSSIGGIPDAVHFSLLESCRSGFSAGKHDYNENKKESI
jgi:hypothetical protein